jgi:HEAT repeat protein
LIQLLKDEDRRVNETAAEALAELKSDAALTQLLPLLKRRELKLRLMAARALAWFKPEQALPALIPMLRDNAPDARRTPLEGIQRFGADALRVHLLLTLEDHNYARAKSKRRQIQTSINNVKDIQVLLSLLKDPVREVRIAAAWALGSCAADVTIRHLLPMVSDVNPGSREAVALHWVDWGQRKAWSRSSS